jgi:hypothetical protein
MKELALSSGAGVTIVDDDDFEYLSQWRWHLNASGYATRCGHPKRGVYEKLYIHRIVIGAQQGQVVDHINGNKLDNRKGNLRLCNWSQNGFNKGKQSNGRTSQYKGVFKTGNRWGAKIQANGRLYNLGGYATEVEAAGAYNEAARELHGEFAHLNDVPETKLAPLSRTAQSAPKRRRSDQNPEVSCACGCGQTFPKFDSCNRPRTYVSGHNGRGLNNQQRHEARLHDKTRI